MSDVADKLRKMKKALVAARDLIRQQDAGFTAANYARHRDELRLGLEALAEFDPDAVGALVDLAGHRAHCPYTWTNRPCDCGYSAALAKLEEKP